MKRAGITSNTVPWEILRAAGYAPQLLDFHADSTPYADRFMEDVFDRRMRMIFDRFCAGACNHLDVIVIPRTSEPEHKLYLYLREMVRSGAVGHGSPRLYLFNLLHTQSAESYRYGLDRTRQMARDFEVSDDALRVAIEESNRARASVREIQRKRWEGWLKGSAALELIRDFYTGDRAALPEQVAAILQSAAAPVAGHRPRILIKGAATCDATLHRSVEEAGGSVVAEDDWRGSRAAGDGDVRLDEDPVRAIFDKYYCDEVSPRVFPSAQADAWFRRQVNSGLFDGVLFYLPPEDDVAGWDYPRHAAFLDERRIPHVVVREEGTTSQIHSILRKAARR
jgi:hypothetical protein